jgi:hypothetical protein
MVGEVLHLLQGHLSVLIRFRIDEEENNSH